MLVREARSIAENWVRRCAENDASVRGATYLGSTPHMDSEDTLPDGSDVDVLLYVDESHESMTDHRRTAVQGLVVDHAAVPSQHMYAMPESVLADAIAAPSLSVPSVILDRDNVLCPLNEVVIREYAKPEWIRRRLDAHRERSYREWINALTPSDPETDGRSVWGPAVMAIATLQGIPVLEPPTVRKSALRFLERCEATGESGLAEKMISFASNSEFTRSDVRSFLASATECYDFALTIHRRPTPFDFELSPVARGHAIDGARELLESKHYHSAVWWIASMWHVAIVAIAIEAEDQLSTFYPRTADFAAALDLDTREGLERKRRIGEQLLEETYEKCRLMLDDSP